MYTKAKCAHSVRTHYNSNSSFLVYLHRLSLQLSLFVKSTAKTSVDGCRMRLFKTKKKSLYCDYLSKLNWIWKQMKEKESHNNKCHVNLFRKNESWSQTARALCCRRRWFRSIVFMLNKKRFFLFHAHMRCEYVCKMM